MNKIILVTKGSYGDLVPFLALGETLKRRGNAVTLITHLSYKETVERLGLQFDSWDDAEQYKAFIADGHLLDSPHGIKEFCNRHIFPTLQSEYAVIRNHCNRDRCVIISRHSGSFAAEFVAEALGLPHVSAFTAVAQVECLPILEELYRSVLGPDINASRVSLGLPSLFDWHGWTTNHRLFLACWPSWFAKSGEDWPRNTINLGFLRSDATESGPLPATIDQIDSPILITGGTAVWSRSRLFYETAMQACTLLDRNSILVCRDGRALPEKFSRNVHVYEKLPFASLFPRISAVIHHGGTSVLVRALTARIPQVVLPFGGDRPDTALRLQNLGVCRRVPVHSWNPETIAKVLSEVMISEAVHQSCMQVECKMRSDHSAEYGCAQIEGLLR